MEPRDRKAIHEKLKPGILGIPNFDCEEIIRIVEGGWVIVDQEYTGTRFTLRVNPKTSVAEAGRRQILTALSRTYGEEPFVFATDFESHRLTFLANR